MLHIKFVSRNSVVKDGEDAISLFVCFDVVVVVVVVVADVVVGGGGGGGGGDGQKEQNDRSLYTLVCFNGTVI